MEDKRIKYCKHCGERILKDAVVCVHCGLQVEILETRHTINHGASNVILPNAKNKWVALTLAIFLGLFGGHKFYEGKVGTGILYICTGALFGIGLVVDIIKLLFSKTYYYV